MSEGSGGSVLRELVVSLFIKSDEKSAKEAESGIDKLKEKLEGLAEVAKAVFEALAVEKAFEFVERTAEAAEQLSRTAARLGTSAEEFQKLQYAATQTGATAESLTTGLTFLARAMDAAKQGSAEQGAAFQRLNVHLQNADGSAKGVQEVFYDVADAIKSTDDPAKRARLTFELMGRGSADLIPTLMQGSEVLRGFGEEAERFGVVQGESFFESAEKFEHGVKRIKAIVGGLSQHLAQPMFDAFTKVFDKLTRWYESHAAEILPAVSRVGKIIGEFFANLAQLVEPFAVLLSNFFTSIREGSPSLELFAAGVGLLMAAFSPWLALFALVALAIEDFYTFLEGGDSYFGDFVDAAKGWWDQLKTLFDPTAFLNIFTAPFNAVGEWIKAWWDQLDALTEHKMKKIAASMTEAMQPAASFFSPHQFAADAHQAIGLMFGGGSSAQAAAANSTNNSSANDVRSNLQANITIHAPAGASSQDIAGSVTSAMGEWFDDKMRETWDALTGTGN